VLCISIVGKGCRVGVQLVLGVLSHQVGLQHIEGRQGVCARWLLDQHFF
jgi:hypothetical protein